MPTLPQVQAVAYKLARASGVPEDRQLDAPRPSSQLEALHSFREGISALMGEFDGKVSIEHHCDKLVGVLVRMALCYGYKSTGSKPNFEVSLVSSWERDGLDVNRVLRGIRKVPDTFKIYPTGGMMKDLIINGIATGWSSEFMCEDAAREKPDQDARKQGQHQRIDDLINNVVED